MAVFEYPVFGMPANSPVQHDTFYILTKLFEFARRHRMVHPFNTLLDDGAFIQVGIDVVGGRADQFDTAIKRLVIGPRAFESWQK